MRQPVFILTLLICTINSLVAQNDVTVLKGGTVIDVSAFGRSSHDLKNAVIIIEGSKIKAVGEAGKIKIPPGANVIDVSGKYIVPGLIEGFVWNTIILLINMNFMLWHHFVVTLLEYKILYLN